ncbi:flagellar motor switch phosphatase FliY [Effusibacillus consociatus]|uniref:Flagellar motor switch phosphatase FliY n=1 Tax=Effusibacillus consociatus TaxID=1117041 RepID=A0ABV9Q408_9BACL
MTGKDFLSQEEIDALLRQSGIGEADTAPPSVELTEFERDALGEIGNISFGTAATALSTLLRQKVEITTPSVSVVRRDELENDLPIPHVVIKVDYTDGFVGSNVLAIRTKDAQIIADLMLGGDGKVDVGELNELHMSAVAEAMNQMMGSAATSMSTIFSMMVNITPPKVDILTFDEQHANALFPMDDVLVKISFRLLVGDLIDSTIMHLVPIKFAKTMLAKLTGKSEEDTAPAPAANAAPPVPEPASSSEQAAAPIPQAPAVPAPNPAVGAPMGYPPVNGYGVPPMGNVSVPTVNVQPAQFAAFDAVDPSVISKGNLNLLLDIPLQVTVELGRTRKQIREILELGPGSILELDKLAGEPVDILVNNKLIAKGEVVVIDENFGVRVTDIITPAERITKLQ